MITARILAMTTLQELGVRVARLEERADNQREDITVFGSELSKIMETQHKHTLRLDQVEVRLDRVDARLDQVDARLDRVEVRLDRVEVKLDEHSRILDTHTEILDTHTQILDGHTQTLDKHTRMFETMFAHFGIPLPAEDHQNN
ncbi:hypothetical protein [Nonomuraea sp. NEAU-A123]|uniref:hypothetical protein n=1 Tax=Nonomuraea sp. NEAU-A123 TaxID=2839649 RepID=UPI001BE45F4D|nr:hypothetical protein [Nonomuraea sp. NEAU-A123]MBT2225601.1 hypothetical protein [Nonomuraea sp. NEAU-A123]